MSSWIIFTLPVGFIHPPVVSCKSWNGSIYQLQEPKFVEYQRRRRSIDIRPGEEEQEQDPASLYIDLEQQPVLNRVKRDEYQDHKAPFVHIDV